MTSSHEEALFDIEPDSAPTTQPSVGHIDIARQASQPSEHLEARLDEMADKLGNYVLARAALGLPLEEEGQEVSPPKRHLPGKPLTYPKRGNVRDFHDGGRSDEYRGGLGAPELGSEADATLRAHLPELQAQRDRVVEENIRNDFEEDVINAEYVRVDAARSRAMGRYRAHIQRHYPLMDSDEVNDLIADFAETLLPPSPLL
jgi:hypothetical protein